MAKLRFRSIGVAGGVLLASLTGTMAAGCKKAKKEAPPTAPVATTAATTTAAATTAPSPEVQPTAGAATTAVAEGAAPAVTPGFEDPSKFALKAATATGENLRDSAWAWRNSLGNPAMLSTLTKFPFMFSGTEESYKLAAPPAECPSNAKDGVFEWSFASVDELVAKRNCIEPFFKGLTKEEVSGETRKGTAAEEDPNGPQRWTAYLTPKFIAHAKSEGPNDTVMMSFEKVGEDLKTPHVGIDYMDGD